MGPPDLKKENGWLISTQISLNFTGERGTKEQKESGIRRAPIKAAKTKEDVKSLIWKKWRNPSKEKWSVETGEHTNWLPHGETNALRVHSNRTLIILSYKKMKYDDNSKNNWVGRKCSQKTSQTKELKNAVGSDLQSERTDSAFRRGKRFLWDVLVEALTGMFSI